jgi:hypothetical protein
LLKIYHLFKILLDEALDVVSKIFYSFTTGRSYFLHLGRPCLELPSNLIFRHYNSVALQGFVPKLRVLVDHTVCVDPLFLNPLLNSLESFKL